MGKFAQLLGLEPVLTEAERKELQVQLANTDHKAEIAQESLARLQLAMEDQGWSKTSQDAMAEFTRPGLQMAADKCRVMAIANPLIKRGLAIRASYVHGQGVGITARADGTEGGQDVNALVQAFLDDDVNRAALTGHQAKLRLETSLGTDGNVFICLVTDPMTGKVTPRTLPFDEVQDKMTMPGDRMITRYYRRDWHENGSDHTAYYPDIRWRPRTRDKWVTDGEQRYPIMWDMPVLHVMDNGLEGWSYGIGDAYAAVPWATAYKEFLEDWVLLIKALSRIAYTASRKKNPASQTARQALNMGQLPAGSTAVMGEGMTLEAMPKSGATIDSESGRPVATMVAAALGIPVTTLMADPGQTGARAVAETLNQPTMLEFKGRQELWTEAYRAILGYVIDQAVIAPRGPLRGTVAREDTTLKVTLAQNTDRTLEIVWPDINELPVETIMNAIVQADGTGKLPPRVLAQLMLRALGVRDVDEILDELTDDDGNWVSPDASAGDAATRAYRRGEDPASKL